MSLPLFLVIIVTVSMSALAQLALKIGVSSATAKRANAHDAFAFLLGVAQAPGVWLGLMIYGASVALWLWVLSRIDLSVAYPFVGLSFLITMGLGATMLHESVTPVRLAGTLLIAVGCVLVARSA
jgi:multidrug transporter EmrE-like cation transporter